MNITIQRYETIDDGMGGTRQEWQDHTELEGTLDKLSGDEVLASDRLGVLSSHIFITFEIKDIKISDRAIIDGEIYDIKDVDNPNNMDRQLEISLEFTGDVYNDEI
ncbi:phage head closure protein [Virgibacillus oceani]